MDCRAAGRDAPSQLPRVSPRVLVGKPTRESPPDDRNRTLQPLSLPVVGCQPVTAPPCVTRGTSYKEHGCTGRLLHCGVAMPGSCCHTASGAGGPTYSPHGACCDAPPRTAGVRAFRAAFASVNSSVSVNTPSRANSSLEGCEECADFHRPGRHVGTRHWKVARNVRTSIGRIVTCG